MHTFLSISEFLLAACAAIGASSATADVLFVDTFDAGASAQWQNEWGDWVAIDGLYDALQPSNFPSARSSLPFELMNFSVEFDVNDVTDGGIWLHSAAAPGTAIGAKGVLLVTKGTSLYWHVVPDGSSYGSIINNASNVFAAGSDPHIRVDVCGPTYAAFVNGSTTPATILTDTTFTVGRVALYDFSVQTFDNVVVEVMATNADLDGDGQVGGADLGALLAGWGPCQPGQLCVGDLNCDGVVDGADLGALLGAWSG